MTPEERAAKCYREMWEGNGTHSTEFVIAGIARAIREAQEEAVQHLRALDTCQTCGGTGALSSGAAEWPCEDCDGTGKCQ